MNPRQGEVSISAHCESGLSFSYIIDLGGDDPARSIVESLRYAADEAARQFGRTDLIETTRSAVYE